MEPPVIKGPRHAIYGFKLFKASHRMFLFNLNKEHYHEQRTITCNAAQLGAHYG